MSYCRYLNAQKKPRDYRGGLPPLVELGITKVVMGIIFPKQMWDFFWEWGKMSGFYRASKFSTAGIRVSKFWTPLYNIALYGYARHNTIEFRQHSGTVEFEKIANWVVFLHNFVEYSKNHLATSFGFEDLMGIQPRETATFYHNRKQDLAA